MRKEVLVGLDRSPAAIAALLWAARYAERTGRPLRAVHVESWPDGVAIESLEPGWIEGLSLHQLEERYRNGITTLFELIEPRPDRRLEFAKGDAGAMLVEQSRRAALLVTGLPSHAGLDRLLAGSVAHYCLSRAVCPVAAVPAAGKTRLDSASRRHEQVLAHD
jgi:nucleotide-binding universal stress UspA family protein